MTIANDILNILQHDSEYVGPEGSAFFTAVFSYGTGIVELCDDAGYAPLGADQKTYVKIEAALGSAEVYVEGQNMPAPIESTVLNAAFSPKAFRGVIRMSGHERRAAGTAGQGIQFGGQSPAEVKIGRCVNRVKDLIAKTLDDAAAYGLQGQVSQTTAFGDQSRSTYTLLRPYLLSASSAAPSTSLINKYLAYMHDSPYGANPTVHITSALQAGKIAELGSGKLYAPSVEVAGGLELIPTGIKLGGAPVFVLPNLGTSTLYSLTGAIQRAQGLSTDAYTGQRTWQIRWHEDAPGRFHVLDLGANNSDIPLNLQISTCLTMYHTNPNEQALLSAFTTA